MNKSLPSLITLSFILNLFLSGAFAQELLSWLDRKDSPVFSCTCYNFFALNRGNLWPLAGKAGFAT